MKDKGLTIWKDQHEFSPCNFEIINWKQEMRKSKLYSWRVSSWYNTKFSSLLEKVMYGHWWRELLFNSWEFTGEINWTVTIWEMNNDSRCTQFCHSLLWIKEKKSTKGLNGIHGLFTTIEVGSLVQVTLATIEIIWNKPLHYFSSVNMSVKDARTCNSLHLIREKLAEMSKAKWNKLKK